MNENFSKAKLDADRVYTVKFDHDSFSGLIKLLGFLPQDVEWTSISESKAINQFGKIL